MSTAKKSKITGTKEAFAAIIGERGINKKLGVERSTVSGWKRYLKDGEKISIDKMESMLTLYGADKINDAIWEI